jgi:hypothetical protein
VYALQQTQGVTAGTWPTWISAVVTSFALMVAALSYARSVKTHREAQARLVYSKVTDISEHQPGTMFELLPNDAKIGCGAEGASIVLPTAPDAEAQFLALAPVIQLTVVIHNGSKELIGPAKVQIFNHGLKKVHDTRSVIVGAIEPESDYIVSFTIQNAHHPGSPSLGTTLIFRDASGQWWRRLAAEQIEAVHNDPENSTYTRTELDSFAANARAMGGEPTPVPKLPWKVRWHRFWRARRGKSPLP